MVQQANEKTFTLNLVTPEALFSSKKVHMVVIPGEMGDFSILPGHEAIISTLRPGLVEIYQGQALEERIFVDGGFAQLSDDVCMVLSEEIIPVGELKAKDLETFIQTTRQTISQTHSQEERGNLISDMQIANAKLEIAKRLLRK